MVGRWLAPAVLVIVATSGWAQPGAPVTDCDRLAASPDDTNAVSPPVWFNEIQSATAESACREATHRFPTVARFSFQLGRVLARQGRHREAADAFDQALARDPDYLAALYLRGVEHYRVSEYTEALRLQRRAADRGYAPSQNALGTYYQRGDSVARDQAEAVRWWKKAADQGFPPAAHSLGQAYERGEGVPRDLSEALRLYRVAARHGWPQARQAAERLEAQGVGAAAGPSTTPPPVVSAAKSSAAPAPVAPSVDAVSVLATPARVRPGETVELLLGYAVRNGGGTTTVRESRTLRFGGTVVESYPVSVERDRTAGRHESHYPQPIPPGAPPGTYDYEGEVCLANRCQRQTATFEVVH